MSDEEKQSPKGPMDLFAELIKSVPGMTRYEPGADARTAAASHWEEYQAHIQVGFTEAQAFQQVIAVQAACADAFIHYHFNPGEANE